ncbi:MAG: hypothetical protein ACTSWY_08265 [Promethearchaeota archaeon]
MKIIEIGKEAKKNLENFNIDEYISNSAIYAIKHNLTIITCDSDFLTLKKVVK